MVSREISMKSSKATPAYRRGVAAGNHRRDAKPCQRDAGRRRFGIDDLIEPARIVPDLDRGAGPRAGLPVVRRNSVDPADLSGCSYTRRSSPLPDHAFDRVAVGRIQVVRDLKGEPGVRHVAALDQQPR